MPDRRTKLVVGLAALLAGHLGPAVSGQSPTGGAQPDRAGAAAVVIESSQPQQEGDPGRARGEIERQLIAIGYAPEEAQDAAGRLTEDDLEVLLANPEMMQAAGGMTANVEAHVAGFLIVVLVIVFGATGTVVIVIG